MAAHIPEPTMIPEKDLVQINFQVPEPTKLAVSSIETANLCGIQTQQEGEVLNTSMSKIELHDGPTEQELATLPRVAGHIDYKIFLVAFVECCERFAYYGCVIIMQNFVQRPRLTPTGAAPNPDGHANNNPGALGYGQQTATALGSFFSWWSYFTPLFGAYVADTYLGRYNTIMWAIFIAIIGHLLLVIGAIPEVMENRSGALGIFIVGITTLAIGTGGFKPNISPLIAEQIDVQKLTVVVRKDGRRVLVDPAATTSRVYHWFYLMINVGALLGCIAPAYIALYEGYWPAFLLPCLLYLACSILMVTVKRRYKLSKPSGAVLGPAVKLWARATKGRWSLNPLTTAKNMRAADFWENVKPSRIPIDQRPKWMTFDDQWVEEVRRAVKACTVFLWFPVYWTAYNQINNNLLSQADTLQHPSVPPEVVSQLESIALIILIPVCDYILYPLLRKAGIRFTPIKRISLGFICASAAMVWSAVLQNWIYNNNECGYYPSEPKSNGDSCTPTRLTVWVQSGAYILMAISEIFASITSLEYAFTKAPKNMRSIVMSAVMFTGAIASALNLAMISLSTDPLLTWNYGIWAVLSFLAGIGVWYAHRDLDGSEDRLNDLTTGSLNPVTSANG